MRVTANHLYNRRWPILADTLQCKWILTGYQFDKTGSDQEMLNEFKTFIMRGNVMDLAVGVIIGAAFGAIVKSLTDDIIMPIAGAIFGGADFSNYFFGLSQTVSASTLDAAREQGAVLAYGSFITTLINFLILAWIIFLMVKGINQLFESVKRKEEQATPPPAPSVEQKLLTEIRDLLAKGN
jgi:large conductance mechanosensitive channel